jgi:hypothetical protein
MSDDPTIAAARMAAAAAVMGSVARLAMAVRTWFAMEILE